MQNDFHLFRGFRPNALTLALALVLIIATVIGAQAVLSHAGDTAQVDVATPLPVPTFTRFVPTPARPMAMTRTARQCRWDRHRPHRLPR